MTDDEFNDKVFVKGKIIPGKNPDEVRADACGSEIHRKDHGSTISQNGWEKDHINPNGGDDLSNMQPLQWENNRKKSDGKLNCDC